MVRQVEDAQATSIIALSIFHPLIEQVRTRVQLERVIFTNIKEHLPSGQRQLFTLLRQEREGHRVSVADGGQSGVDEFRAAAVGRHPFDVVLTDLGMPYFDGRQVVKAIKEEWPATPIIFTCPPAVSA